ncbi:YkvA family protein [Tundrisphaera lichenicola]|uniref:YkvA family protein n=1 Tax=Tundrisphaera lichenicola TaxID=2029860 RepID=UPI003EBFB867
MTTETEKASWWSKVGIDPSKYVGRDESRAEATAREGFAAKAKRSLRRIPMARETVSLYFCLLDPTTPMWVKGIVAGALAYFVLPLDAIPDVLPFVGLSDDASILAAAYTAVSAFVTEEHREKARRWIEDEHLTV